MGTTDDAEDTEDRDVKGDSVEKRYPSLEVAEARIKQALLRYRVTVERSTPTTETQKVRL